MDAYPISIQSCIDMQSYGIDHIYQDVKHWHPSLLAFLRLCHALRIKRQPDNTNDSATHTKMENDEKDEKEDKVR